MGASCLGQAIPIYRLGTPGAYEYDERDMGQEPITEAHLGIPFVSQRDSALMTCPQNQISECEHMDNILDNLQEHHAYHIKNAQDSDSTDRIDPWLKSNQLFFYPMEIKNNLEEMMIPPPEALEAGTWLERIAQFGGLLMGFWSGERTVTREHTHNLQNVSHERAQNNILSPQEEPRQTFLTNIDNQQQHRLARILIATLLNASILKPDRIYSLADRTAIDRKPSSLRGKTDELITPWDGRYLKAQERKAHIDTLEQKLLLQFADQPNQTVRRLSNNGIDTRDMAEFIYHRKLALEEARFSFEKQSEESKRLLSDPITAAEEIRRFFDQSDVGNKILHDETCSKYISTYQRSLSQTLEMSHYDGYSIVRKIHPTRPVSRDFRNTLHYIPIHLNSERNDCEYFYPWNPKPNEHRFISNIYTFDRNNFKTTDLLASITTQAHALHEQVLDALNNGHDESAIILKFGADCLDLALSGTQLLDREALKLYQKAATASQQFAYQAMPLNLKTAMPQRFFYPHNQNTYFPQEEEKEYLPRLVTAKDRFTDIFSALSQLHKAISMPPADHQQFPQLRENEYNDHEPSHEKLSSQEGMTLKDDPTISHASKNPHQELTNKEVSQSSEVLDQLSRDRSLQKEIMTTLFANLKKSCSNAIQQETEKTLINPRSINDYQLATEHAMKMERLISQVINDPNMIALNAAAEERNLFLQHYQNAGGDVNSLPLFIKAGARKYNDQEKRLGSIYRSGLSFSPMRDDFRWEGYPRNAEQQQAELEISRKSYLEAFSSHEEESRK